MESTIFASSCQWSAVCRAPRWAAQPSRSARLRQTWAPPARGGRIVNPLDAINRWNDAWNTGDTNAVAAVYADDVVYQHAMLPEPITGRDAVRGFISGMGGAFSDIDDAIAHAVVSGDEVAAEVRHRARHTGDSPT